MFERVRAHSWLMLIPGLLFGCSTTQPELVLSPEDQVLDLIRRDQPYAMVSGKLFERLGWDLPDGGKTVKALADAAPGGAFKPEDLESLSAERLGYKAKWHVIRFPYYGLLWDITGLELIPNESGDVPTVAFIHGGSANWYEFFLDPLNNAGIAQYLAQRIPVLLITIPGNYKPGGWTEDFALRKPAYLLDYQQSEDEIAVRNAVFTFALICEGVVRLVRQVTQGPLLIAGHSTGGEIQFLLRDALKSQLRSRSLGWGTGGPALLRREWEEKRKPSPRPYSPLTKIRGRSPEGYTNGYVGPLNPLAGNNDLEVARQWFAREARRRPQFKQPIQDLEHQGRFEHRDRAEEEIRNAVEMSGLAVDVDAVIADLFSTLRTQTGGYTKMIWTVAASDRGHWNEDPADARELFVAGRFRERNPEASIRVLVFDVPMTHYGHIEKPRQLAGGILSAVKWLYE